MAIQRMMILLRLGLILAFTISLAGMPQYSIKADTNTVTNTNDSGAGSLRQAILDANSNPGSDIIEFNIPTSDVHYEEYTPGVFTIILTSGTLLMGDDSTYIYGNTQSANQGNTNPDGWEIEVYDGTKSYPVFTITSDFNILMYLSITGGTIGVDLSDDANWNTLNTNSIGLDGDAALKVPNGNGVQIRGSSDFNTLAGNVIAGNDGFGVQISDSNSNNLDRNYIGTNPNSATNLGNSYDGINITGTSTQNVIGESNADRNVISCNGYNGIKIDGAPGNEISYNHIGTNYAGTIDMGNTQRGIYVGGGADLTEIAHNLISGNTQSGIWVYGTGTDATNIYDNIIGSNLAITAALGNGEDGISINFLPANTSIVDNILIANAGNGLAILFGSYTSVRGNYIGTGIDPAIIGLGNGGIGIEIVGDNNTIGGDVAGRNIISSNSGSGVSIVQATYNEISYNFIGTDDTGTLDLGNSNAGISLYIDAQYNTIDNNLISGNQSSGIVIAGEGAYGNIFSNNKIGSNLATTGALGNSGHGILLTEGSSASMVQNNIIIANGYNGLYLYNTEGNLAAGNRIGIGTDPSIISLGNNNNGIRISGTSSGNTLGGNDLNRNVISCNSNNGVWIEGASGNEISYNHIGTDFDGTLDLGNQQHGIFVSDGAVNSTISHNLISGNGQDGVYVIDTGTDMTNVSFNRIGSNAAVTVSIGNDWHGIGIFDGPTLTSVSSNVIVGNGWSGLVFQNAINNTAAGNYIGTDSSGTLSTLGNTYYGVHILGSDNTVSGGIIAYNGSSTTSDGVRVDGSPYSSIHNRITEASIFYNGGKGIENINGGNNNYTGPVLDPDLSCVHVSGTVPFSKARIEIFTGPDDEGKNFEGSTVSDGLGNFSWNGSMRGYAISLTWTDPSGSTSEFTATNNYPPCNILFLPLTLK